MLSLNSIARSQNVERSGSDSEALTDGNSMVLGAVRVAESKSSDLETKITGSYHEHADMPPMPADRIMMHNGISFEEERLKNV